MENCVYELERYEGWNDDECCLGIFSTIEKAKEYAEKDISTIKVKYKIDEDWSDDGIGGCDKRLIIDEDNPAYFSDDECDINYTIIKRKLDPEYKED